ncbi:hypothetical protein Pta02_05050 [Planobispora takensis]|uniref:Uncharacterized protein n=1 Tax=Planobispora takensis TaxID=1367882 RepID=A0A8J3ST77_9ACTN|nr:hypothetical protein Pta02_05050 [Planobispora takensis]
MHASTVKDTGSPQSGTAGGAPEPIVAEPCGLAGRARASGLSDLIVRRGVVLSDWVRRAVPRFGSAGAHSGPARNEGKRDETYRLAICPPFAYSSMHGLPLPVIVPVTAMRTAA